MASKSAAQAKLIPSKQKPVRQVTLPGSPLHFGSLSGGWTPPQQGTAPGSPSAGPPQTTAVTPSSHKTVEPFNTPDESLNKSDRWAAFQGGVFDIDAGLANLRANTDYEKTNIDKQLVANTSASIDGMIGRGLSQSSIQQGELADLQGSATRRKTYLDTTLSTAVIEGGRRKSILSNNWDDFIDYYNRRATLNAQDVPTAPDPGPAAAPGAAATAGPAQYSGPTGLQNGKYIDHQGGTHAIQTKGGKRYYLTGSGQWQVF